MAEDFDIQWKFRAVELAAREQLEMEGVLDTSKLFKTARAIYSAGYRYEIDKWDSAFKKKDVKEVVDVVPVVDTTEEVVDVASIVNTKKKCGGCSEMINIKWTKHAYKSDGQRCGYIFEENAI